MDTIFRGVLAIHVVSGLVALGVFWAALAQRKGSGRHRVLGRAYVAWMSISLATATMLAGLVIGWPLAIHPSASELDAVALATHARELRAFAAMLGEGALITMALLFLGLRAVRGPRARGVRFPLVDCSVACAYLAAGIASVAHLGDGEGLILAGTLLSAVLLGTQSPRRRLREHMIGILGSGAGAHTAFVVSVIPRILPGLYERDPSIHAAPWLIPPLLGLVGILYALHRYGRTPEQRSRVHLPIAHARLRRA